MTKQNELVEKINMLWVEKYRPDNIDSLAIDKEMKMFLQASIDSGDIPNILLHGNPGTGKNSIVNVLKSQMDLQMLVINASEERGIDTIREKVQGFARSASWGEKLKVVVLNEADGLNYIAQDSLRELMETASKTCRFILTCNYVSKISDAIRSRTNEFEISPKQLEIAERLLFILESENIEFTDDFLVLLIKTYGTDMRKMINECQKFSKIYKKFDSSLFENVSNKYNDFFDKIFSTNDIKKMAELTRKMIFTDDVYSALYQYVVSKFDNSDMVMVVADCSYKSKFIFDKDLSLMSCFLNIKEMRK